MSNPKIRVLVVDDSSIMRRLLTRVIESDSDLEVIGKASNGQIALRMIAELKPDVITLDLEMPIVDGIQVLDELRRKNNKIPVIVISSLTQSGAKITFTALAKGALDCLAKPQDLSSAGDGFQHMEENLVPMLKGLSNVQSSATNISSPKRFRGPGVRTPLDSKDTRKSRQPIEIVTIGISTGGPNALAECLPHLRSNFPVPIVIVQHMPPVFTEQLAKRLQQSCSLEVKEAESGDKLQPGTIWLAPGNYHVVVKRQGAQNVIETNQDPKENSCRPAADVLFRSAAELFGPSVLGVVMTGMGRDGLVGSEIIKRAGGRTLAQDEPSSVVWGMAGSVVSAGLADNIVPLSHIAPAITSEVSFGRTSHKSSTTRELV